MPKSKRAKVVHLTKVDKKGKELTIKLFANVRECLDLYQHCFVFSVDNMRNTYLKDVRNELSDSRCAIYFDLVFCNFSSDFFWQTLLWQDKSDG